MRNFSHQLILNHITAEESLPPFNKDFEDYQKVASLFLNHKGKHLFAEDLLNKYNKGMTLEKLFEQEKGRFFDLRRIFDKLNTRHFSGSLQGYRIVWGRKRRLRPRRGITFAYILEEHRLIRVHPLLDRSFVPVWFLEYVIYHEMCHAMVPDEFDARGRRLVHHARFYALERRFPGFRRAKAWEAANLARFLR